MAKGLNGQISWLSCLFVILIVVFTPVAGAVENSQNGKTEEKNLGDANGENKDVIEQSGDFCSDAESLKTNQRYSSAIDWSKDVDWYKFYLPSYGKFTFSLEVPSGKDYDLAVYSSCGDSNRVCLSNNDAGYDENCVNNLGPGWVYVKIYGFGLNDYSVNALYYMTAGFQAIPQYDLVPVDFTITPANPYDSDAVKIIYRFKNQGVQDINKYFINYLSIDGVVKQTCYNDGVIYAGQTYDCVFENVRLSSGSHTLKHEVDAEKHIAESNENNNVKTQSLNVQSKVKKYDLYGNRFEVTPSSPYDTSSITIKPVIVNSGSDDINDKFIYRFYIDNVLYPACGFDNGLRAGNEGWCEYGNIHLTSGSHVLKLYIDPENSVGETNEGNNLKEGSVNVLRDTSGDYDLIVNDIWTEPSNVQGGSPFTLKFSVDNVKPTSINKQFTNQLYINNQLLMECKPVSLADGFVNVCSMSGVSLSAGSYSLRAVADSGKVINEINEGNNERTESLVVANPPRYDVVVSSLWVEPVKVISGEGFNVKFVVANLEEGVITKSFIARLYLNDEYKGYCDIPAGLARGSAHSCSVPISGLASGNYYLKAVGDFNNDITESNEGNNQRTIILNVAVKPCAVPDGNSESCDCDYNYDCPSQYPYCQDEYPNPISDGYDACLAVKPVYCGDRICNNGETWGSCSKDCNAPSGRIYVDVKNNQRNPVTGAFVYLDDGFKGSTSSIGKVDFVSGYGNKNVKILCPDNSYCGTRSVAVDGNEYLGFQCGCQSNQYGDLEVYVYNQNNYPLVNVIGYLDGNEVGLSNPFGLIRKERVSYGSHNLRLKMYVAKYDPIKEGEYNKVISINNPKVVEKIVIRESDLKFTDTSYRIDAHGNVISGNSSEQIIFLAAIPIVMEIIDVASVSYSATEFCKCAYGTDNLAGGAKECFDTLIQCSAVGFNAQNCLNGVQAFSAAKDACFSEAAFLVGDIASPLIPVGLIGGVILKTGKKFSWADNAFRWVGKQAKDVWQYTKKFGDNIVTFFAKTGDEGVKRSMQLGRRVISEWDDEAYEGLNKIISKGSLKSADGLIEALGEEGAKKLSRNIEKLSKKKVNGHGIKGLDELQEKIAKFGKLYDEGKIANNANAMKGAAGNLKGLVFEAEVAAHPKYIDEVAEIRKSLVKSQGDIDVLLKDGTIIDAKSRNFPLHLDVINKISQQARKYSLEDPQAKIKFLVKREPSDYPLKLMNEEIAEVQKYVKETGGIDIVLEVFEP